MADRPIPFYNRILFKLLVPVVGVGGLCATLFVFYMSSPLKAFLLDQFDANLKLASAMGLQECDESFNYLLDLRLEESDEMNLVMKKETLDKIVAISRHFPRINILVQNANGQIQACSIAPCPENWEGDAVEKQKGHVFPIRLAGRNALARAESFPFWGWHIVSFVFEEDVQAPIHMAYAITYLSAAGVFAAVVITLLAVFHLFIRKPLKQLIAFTDGVAKGRLSRIGQVPDNEFGRLTASFNTMIDSLESEKESVRRLIQRLEESEALFRSQFEYGNIGIAIVDPDGKAWVRANQRLCRLLGYTESELHQVAWEDLFVPKNNADRGYGRMRIGEIDSYETEMTLTHRNGAWVYTHLNVSCIRDEDRTLQVVIVSVLDITDRKKAEMEKEQLSAQLLQVQKMEAIGTLAGGIAHDFNNILSGIFGYAQLAKDVPGLPRKASQDIDNILKGASRAAELVQQILTFSRKTADEKQYLHLFIIVKEVVKLIRSTIPATIGIREEIRSQSGILADPIQMHQVVMNLCTNAYHAMAESGGELRIKLDEVTLPASGNPDDTRSPVLPFLELEVRDTGQGMDDATMKKIFEPYFTTKPREKGTGLGLALVHAIVGAHGGFVRVESRKGQGSVFRVYLPVAQRPQRKSRTDKDDAPLPWGTESIMFVDDEESIRLFNRSYLEKFGYRVAVFENGLGAWERFRQSPDAFDLVVTDVAMPGMDGRELAAKMLEIRNSLPIIICTGFCENFDEAQAGQMGFRRYVHKPVPPRAMARLIRTVLDEDRSGPAAVQPGEFTGP